MNKKEREIREYKSLFNDERYAKKAWREIIGGSLESSGKPLPTVYEPRSGDPTLNSIIDVEAYNNCKERLTDLGIEREPMQAELIVESNILRARFTDTTFNIILDRTAGKVKDEIEFSGGQYESLSDEELDILIKYRESKEKGDKLQDAIKEGKK